MYLEHYITNANIGNNPT